MKHGIKLFAVIIAFSFCFVFAACSVLAGNNGRDSTKAESESEVDTEAETEAETGRTINVGIIPWSTLKADEREFVEAVQSTLSEQYSDQIGEVFMMDAVGEAEMLPLIAENMIVMWEDENVVILIVNGEDGFSDEDLLSVIKDLGKDSVIFGVDHAINDAPEGTFVYDASDPAVCAEMILENAFKER